MTEAKKRSNKKYTIEEVKQIFKEGGCTLLSTEYKSNKTKMKYICECNEEKEINLSNFMMGKRCFECGNKKSAESNTLLIDDIKIIFKEHECLLLSEYYQNSYADLEYICPKGHSCISTLQKFRLLDSNKCTQCTSKKQHTIESARAIFLENGCELIEEEYINSHVLMRYICKCGETSYMSLSNIKAEKHCSECKKTKLSIANSGENSPSWNSSLTEEDRASRRRVEGYTNWVYNVYKNDGFRCAICKSKEDGLNAHHKDGYHWCRERRVDPDNGVTLCIPHHTEFHSIYGRGNNTEKQWDEFYELKMNERRIS